MDTTSLWITAPSDANRFWQEAEAVGADRKPFSARSRVQHAAMFARFHRHLVARGASLSTFGTEHIDSFFNDVETRCAPGTTTRLRYARMLDRLCRHLVEIEVRSSNPATGIVAFQRWPDDEPPPLYLDPSADHRLQGWVAPTGTDDTRILRNRAIVALLLGGGITAAELRRTQRQHVVVEGVRPHVHVPKQGPREPRKVTLPEFSHAALIAWKEAHALEADHALLFPAPGNGTSINDVLLGAVVKDALAAIGFLAPDMSPRVLRNTFARRQLLSGRTNEDTTRMLGLVSHRTVTRLRATIVEACECR
ncbi:site-specific recombinase XerC [Paraburkholderia atlantica]|uniref:tyrosine-type recombinase/integrase n=1 Tax=Paraburkholderia atlantica TaxID=2654982 RepID=UPI003D1EAE24